MATPITPVPQPLAVTGVVSNDLANRTLTVRLSDLEQGFPRLCWKASYAALRRSEESGWRTDSRLYGLVPTVPTGWPLLWLGTMLTAEGWFSLLPLASRLISS
jgi:hypothetical protein